MNCYCNNDADLMISSVSSITATSALLWMSLGTLTPHVVVTPQLTPSMANLSLGEKYTCVDHKLLSMGGLTFASSMQPSAGSHSSAGMHSAVGVHTYTLTPMPVNLHPSSWCSLGALMEDLFGSPQSTRRQKGDPVWVII